jgi:hypothetical protein
MILNPRELSTETGARELAEILVRYWRDQGADVAIRVESVTRSVSKDGRAVFGVRSNLVNGLPAMKGK